MKLTADEPRLLGQLIARNCIVMLDGKHERNCIVADEQWGWCDVYACDREGNLIPDFEDDECRVIRKYGVVEITLPDDKLKALMELLK